MRFTVITPSFLGDYSGAATNRVDKFHRSVHSLKAQFFTDVEFIIVSDGCPDTTRIMKEEYGYLLEHRNFKLIELPKQVLHSGHIRQAGMEIGQGEYFVFVDSDDFIGMTFLYDLDKALRAKKEPDVAYYNVNRWDGPLSNKQIILKTKPEENHIGNGMFTFKKKLTQEPYNITYEGFDGYKHDWKFFKSIKEKTQNIKELNTMEYYVCHIPGVIDL